MNQDSSNILMLAMSALIAPKLFENRCQIGVNRLYDKTEHKYSTDAEEHLLNKIEADPNNSFLWNRLGNLYQGGSRPELAVAAFEKSLMIDPNQAESHFSLGCLLEKAMDVENAAYHFRQMMLTAEGYRDVDALRLRDLLAKAIQSAFFIHMDPDQKIPFIPGSEEIMASGKDLSQFAPTVEMDIEIFPDDLTSFYPIAEMYLGKRRMEIPKWKQKLKLSAKVVKKKKKKR